MSSLRTILFPPFFSFLSWFYPLSYFEPCNFLIDRGFNCPRSHRRDLCRATDAGAAARAQRREGERPARHLSGQRLVEQHMCSISSIRISISIRIRSSSSSSSSSPYHRDYHRPPAILSCEFYGGHFCRPIFDANLKRNQTLPVCSNMLFCFFEWSSSLQEAALRPRPHPNATSSAALLLGLEAEIQ
jgi:hypothetical protein